MTIGTGQAPVEVWYPAKIGSAEGKAREVYDFIKWLPPEAQEEVPANEKPVPVLCNCYRDLPIDNEHDVTFYLFGMEWYLHPKFRLSPNLEVVNYGHGPLVAGADIKNDVVPRLTLYWSWP